MYPQILPGCSLGAQWQHLLLPAELIYEEVIDWEERNKNGLMKEDCSGRSGRRLHYSLPFFFSFFMLQVTVGLWPPLNSVVWISPLSRVRCCVWFGLSVLVGQRHFVHVHGADAGLGHGQQQHRHTDGTAGRESVIAVPVGRSDWLSSPPSKFKYQPSASLLSSSHLFFVFLVLCVCSSVFVPSSSISYF